ncbi:inositol monophosphatase family protein [Erysipelothrix urinaevulpis]|uniref:inositol monophosphatase family protein n=1 Tax=Erysipelothrix urinaevulpis TaxID=2683717 RepID=UPI001359AE74|nr:inositol monophosphatase family protein [Erysipelothrix urinaevulpis]
MKTKIEFTKKLVYKAKDYILDQIENNEIKVDTKSSYNDFVTSVDKGVENFLVNAITNEFNNQTFLTEEAMVENKVGDESWIIDPIDGTTNFVYNQQYFAISIAHYVDGKPAFGIVYDVMADELYLGIHGEGAYINGKKLETLDQSLDFPDVIVSSSYSIFNDFDFTPEELNSNIIAHRYIGSAAIEICHVAHGRLHVYQARRLNLYDIAAAVIILDEVSGKWRFGDHYNSVNVGHESSIFYAGTNDNIFNFMDKNYLK